MPCQPSKARRLLKDGKAKVVRRTPFTVQLTIATGETVQPITLGVDSGYVHIGLSAVSEKEELLAADVELRSDMVKLHSERRAYRKNRRFRKTRYRAPRFLNRRKPDGWLSPSIQHKLDSHIKLIDSAKNILPVTDIVVEVAAFDIQKIKNPDIEGIQYQQGEQAGFWNTREYVLYRDGHQCQHCKGKSKDSVLNVHHIVSRQIGGDRPENLITSCETCHRKHHAGELKMKVKPSNGLKAETFMSTVRWMLINHLKDRGEAVRHTYGYITKRQSINQNLPKSHISDAFVIASGNGQQRAADYLLIKQVRKCNRKLFKGDRSHIKNSAPRFVLGFQRYDKVRWQGQECFIFGRRSRGYFHLRKLDGTKVHGDAQVKQCTLLESSRPFLVERRCAVFSPA